MKEYNNEKMMNFVTKLAENISITLVKLRRQCLQYMHHAHSPETGVVKVPSAGGLLPYSLMACTDHLYCVLCWRWGRGREVAVMAEKGREVEVLVRVMV